MRKQMMRTLKGFLGSIVTVLLRTQVSIDAGGDGVKPSEVDFACFIETGN
jgi:hypothetical protein